MNAKIDLRKTLKHLYNPSPKMVVEVTVPPMNFLMIDGQGDPNTAASYQQALEALFGVSYALKFMSKREHNLDYAVMPLEGLWWVEGMDKPPADFDFTADKNGWSWTAMIMQPQHITAAMVEAAVISKREKDTPALDKIRFETFEEGRAAHIMHLGSFASEKPTIDKIMAFISEQGCTPAGKHHEIYLSDFRRTAPDKLKTIIRHPMR